MIRALSLFVIALLSASAADAEIGGRLVSGSLDGGYLNVFECRAVNRSLNEADVTLFLFSAAGGILTQTAQTTLQPSETVSLVSAVSVYPGLSTHCEAQVTPNDAFVVGNLTVRTSGPRHTQASSQLEAHVDVSSLEERLDSIAESIADSDGDSTPANAFEVARVFCNGVAGCDDGNGLKTTREFEPMLVSSMTVFVEFSGADGLLTLRGPSDDEFSGPKVWELEPYFGFEDTAINGVHTVTFPNPIPVASVEVLCFSPRTNPGCGAILSLTGTR